MSDEKLKKVTGGEGLGPHEDWYELINSIYSSYLPVEEKERQLMELIPQIENDVRLMSDQIEYLCDYIRGICGNGR